MAKIVVFQKNPKDVIWTVRCDQPILELEFGTFDDAMREAERRAQLLKAELIVYPRRAL